MPSPNIQLPPRRVKEDALTLSLDPVGQTLAATVPGQEREWADNVGRALAQVEKALRLHIIAAQAPDGVLAEVDDTRPTLARHKQELQQALKDHLEQCLALQEEVRRAGEAFARTDDALAKAGALPERAGTGGVADFGALRARGEQLVVGVRRLLQAETGLIQESVNTEIGVGD
jgi:hypothetical protein